MVLVACKKLPAGAEDSDAPSSLQLTAADLHPCDVTGTQLTYEDCDAAGRWVAESKRGTAAFNAPARMIQGQSKIVTLAVGTQAPPPPPPSAADAPAPAGNAAQAASDLEQTASDAGRPPAKAAEPTVVDTGPSPHDVAAAAAPDAKVIDYYPFVGHQMAADLEGGGFDISPLSPRIQPVMDGAVTTWSWKVTAREYGQKPLIMKTTVVMTDSRGKTQPLKPTSDPKMVTVIIGPMGVLNWFTTGTNWLKAIGAFLVALAGAVTAWKALKPKPPAQP